VTSNTASLPLDLIVRGATVFDGTGSPGRRADVGVRKGVITAVGAIGPESPAARSVRADGLALCPGFIDIHSHADIALLREPASPAKALQGVTTEVFSNCGLGFAPANDVSLEMQRAACGGLFGEPGECGWSWRSVADLLALYEERGVGANVAYLAPHGAVRTAVLGAAARPASADERRRMADLVREAREQGAWGISTGPWYAPMRFADRAEFVELARPAGFFATHLRDYGEGLMDAIAETASIAREAGARAQVSHLQLGSPSLHGRASDVLEALEAEHRAGAEIGADAYPYGAGATLVHALLPSWATAGEPRELDARLADAALCVRMEADLRASGRDLSALTVLGAGAEPLAPLEGRTFGEGAREVGTSVEGLVCLLARESRLRATFIAPHTPEEDLVELLRWPHLCIGSDGLHLPDRTHPRLWGTFARVLARYARRTSTLTLEEALRKMTSAPAGLLGIRDRGVLAPGMAADLTLFDPALVQDHATYGEPDRPASGVRCVWVNGVAVVEEGRPTGRLPGRVLRPS